jgi:hypothetical protein
MDINKSEKLLFRDLILTEELLHLLHLDERSKRIFEMRFIDGLTLDEIGERLNLSGERVRQIFSKSLLRIRSRVEALSREFLLLESFKKDIILLEAENANLRKKIEYFKTIVPTTEIDILGMQIQSTTLSIRAKNCLKSAKVNTLKDLIRYSKSDILGFHNIGMKTVQEIEFFISSCGLKFKE